MSCAMSFDAFVSEIEKALRRESLLRDSLLLGMMTKSFAIPIKLLVSHPFMQYLGATEVLLRKAAQKSVYLSVDSTSNSIIPDLTPRRTTLIFRDLPPGTTETDLCKLLTSSPEFAVEGRIASAETKSASKDTEGEVEASMNDASQETLPKSFLEKSEYAERQGRKDTLDKLPSLDVSTSASSGKSENSSVGCFDDSFDDTNGFSNMESGVDTSDRNTTDQFLCGDEKVAMEEPEIEKGPRNLLIAGDSFQLPSEIVEIRKDVGDCWFVKLVSEDLTQKLAIWLRSATFRGQKLKVGIKSSLTLRNADLLPRFPQCSRYISDHNVYADNLPRLGDLHSHFCKVAEVGAETVPEAGVEVDSALTLSEFQNSDKQQFQSDHNRVDSDVDVAESTVASPVSGEVVPYCCYDSCCETDTTFEKGRDEVVFVPAGTVSCGDCHEQLHSANGIASDNVRTCEGCVPEGVDLDCSDQSPAIFSTDSIVSTGCSTAAVYVDGPLSSQHTVEFHQRLGACTQAQPITHVYYVPSMNAFYDANGVPVEYLNDGLYYGDGLISHHLQNTTTSDGHHLLHHVDNTSLGCCHGDREDYATSLPSAKTTDCHRECTLRHDDSHSLVMSTGGHRNVQPPYDLFASPVEQTACESHCRCDCAECQNESCYLACEFPDSSREGEAYHYRSGLCNGSGREMYSKRNEYYSHRNYSLSEEQRNDSSFYRGNYYRGYYREGRNSPNSRLNDGGPYPQYRRRRGPHWGGRYGGRGRYSGRRDGPIWRRDGPSNSREYSARRNGNLSHFAGSGNTSKPKSTDLQNPREFPALAETLVESPQSKSDGKTRGSSCASAVYGKGLASNASVQEYRNPNKTNVTNIRQRVRRSNGKKQREWTLGDLWPEQKGLKIRVDGPSHQSLTRQISF